MDPETWALWLVPSLLPAQRTSSFLQPQDLSNVNDSPALIEGSPLQTLIMPAPPTWDMIAAATPNPTPTKITIDIDYDG